MGSKKKIPIDPVTGIPMILEGRIVTMDPANRVIDRGRLYVKDSTLLAVQAAEAPPPAGFAGVAVTKTGGTLYPGLIELHNHLAYNALRLWAVPKLYTNRDQWSGIPAYRQLVSGPMTVIGESPDLLPALVRYVEMKCLVGGVTTSQGIALFSNAGARRFYRGIVRNVESTDEAVLPEAQTRVADVDARSASAFLERLKKETCFLLHLSEGVDPSAHKHFEALRIEGTRWAILPQLAGIHAVALTAQDFALYGARGASIIWSPLSNCLLYGKTADVKAAKAAGVRIGIGSDWSPSGSKNLLGELKVARIVADQVGGFSSREILAMATRQAADILQWGEVLGSLEPGKRADLLLVKGTTGDPYDALIEAAETDIQLVVINGVPRFGTKSLFDALGATGESLKIGGEARRVYLAQDTQDPAVGKLTYAQAKATLADALKRLPQLAKALEKPKTFRRGAMHASTGPVWRLALDELEPTGNSVRARLPLAHTHARTGAKAQAGKGTQPLSEILKPLVLDPLTVADDTEFAATLLAQKNLPAWIVAALRALYG